MAHAGFGFVLQIERQTLDELLLIGHRAGQLIRNLAGSFPAPDAGGDGEATLTLDVFVDAPRVILDSSLDGLVRVLVRAAGTLIIDAASIDSAPRDVELAMEIDCGVTIGLAHRPEPHPTLPNFLPPVDVFDATLQFSPTTVVASKLFRRGSGPPLPQVWRDFFSSQLFRLGAGSELSEQLSDVSSTLPTDFVPLIDALGVGADTTVTGTAIVHNGFLSLGFDCANSALGVATTGNPAKLNRFLEKSNVAAWINPVLAPLLARAVRLMVNESTDAYDVTSTKLEFISGQLRLTGHAETSQGSANFRVDLKPRIGRPGWVETIEDEYGTWGLHVPPTDEVWLDVTDVDVDVSPDPWLVILGIVGGAIVFAIPVVGAGVIAMVAALVRDGIAAIPIRIVKRGERSLLLAKQTILLPGTNRPLVLFELKTLVAGPAGLVSRLTLKPQFGGGISGPGSMPIEGTNQKRSYTISEFPHWDRDDPAVRVRWQVRRVDTNAVVWTVEKAGSDPAAHKITVNFFKLGALEPTVNSFSVTVRVFRIGDFISEVDYLNSSMKVVIADRVDRSHPYFRWRRTIIIQRLGQLRVERRSALHRTVYPGRCQFVDQHTHSLDAVHEYLDELPFAIEQIPNRRKEICEYCFFGGPDKDKLVFDPSAV